jgi:uncharacterized membrane protein YgcG
VRLAVPVLATGAVLAGAPAQADVPVGWPDPPSIPLMDGLLVYVFAPVALFVLIALLTVAPSLARGERLGQRPGGTGGDEWFGGRRGGPDELESGRRSLDSGGASGQW